MGTSLNLFKIGAFRIFFEFLKTFFLLIRRQPFLHSLATSASAAVDLEDMRFATFQVHAEKIESAKFRAGHESNVLNFAIQRTVFRIQKLERLLELARKAPGLRIAKKKKKIWAKRLSRFQKNLKRFEQLKADHPRKASDRILEEI